MLVLEFKAYGKLAQFNAVDEAIRTVQFIRNKSIRFWMDNENVDKYDLNKYCAVLAKEYPFVDELNSMARQASAERAWAAISQQVPARVRLGGNPSSDDTRWKKGFPQFQKDNRSVEYKTTGWKLDPSRKYITFTDKKGIGKLKLKGYNFS